MTKNEEICRAYLERFADSIRIHTTNEIKATVEGYPAKWSAGKVLEFENKQDLLIEYAYSEFTENIKINKIITRHPVHKNFKQ